MSKPAYSQFMWGGPTTAADVAAQPGPSISLTWIYIDEFDAYYRWVLGDATVADGVRVIGQTGGSAGRWILLDERVTISSIGAGDWARLHAVMVAMAYKGAVHLNPGSWQCDSAQITPSGTRLVLNAGVNIVSTLPGGGGSFANSVFYNDGGRPVPATTMLAANAAAGSMAITVASAAGLAIGDTILVQRGVAWWYQRKIVNIVGAVVTLDRPLLRPFVIGNDVRLLPAALDIRIEGHGATITGTGTAPLLFASARDCVVEDLHCAASMTFGFVYDVGSRDCEFRRCTMDCQGVTPSAFIFTLDENCRLVDCDSYRPANFNAYITSCDNCQIVRGVAASSLGSGVLFQPEDVTDTIGCRGCSMEDATVIKAAVAGVVFNTVSSGNTLVGVVTSFNQTGVLFNGAGVNDNVIEGGLAQGNTSLAVSNSGLRNKVKGQAVIEHDVGVYESSAGGELGIYNCSIVDASAVAATAAMVAVTGANSIVRMAGVMASSSRNLQHFIRSFTATARVYVDGATRFTGTGVNNFGIIVDAGVVRVAGFTATCQIGVYLNGATAFGRIADDVDCSGCVTPFFTAAGAFNRGQVVLNAATPVAVAFGDAKATDRFFCTLRTAGGVPTGVLVTGAPNVGVGFTVVGLAGDTSTYDYDIH